LLELLTVMGIIAVLASLLLTAVASARKNSRRAYCSSNLHQISLALNLYVDDMGTRPGMGDLVTNHFLSSAKMLCPEDNVGDWGNLLLVPPQVVNPVVPITNMPSVSYSYMVHPLAWDISLWNYLMRSSSQSGLAACQLHGLGSQSYSDVHDFSGLLLRAQRDGAVVQRNLFWDTAPSNLPIPGVSTNQAYLYPLPVYVDDPVDWLQGDY
jgi:type II secretory pathway pseudopilin PulG